VGKGVLDSPGDGVDGCQFEGLICVVKGLAGLASGGGFADVVESKGGGLPERRSTLALLVFIKGGK
jgi:hypothetical protein